ncbi:MAG TPA: uroporphyrinogen-III synthase [Stellaceae bacterium]|nr:uroporphyrinogen-III synthase [Stellaceae bacterium]
MRVLITRPLAAATALSARLAALGHQALIEPLLTIVDDPEARTRLASALEDAQALLFTSSNGVTSFAVASERRDLPAFAVGDGTAAVARQSGFARVESARGDVEALAALVERRLKPSTGPIIHPSGHAVAGDLAGRLAQLGFTVRSVPIYHATAADRLSADTVGAFRAGQIDAALFFSPRTAATFVRLACAAGIEHDCARIAVVTLSAAVASDLEGLGWRQVVVAEAPTEKAMLRVLDGLAAEMRRSGAPNQ